MDAPLDKCDELTTKMMRSTTLMNFGPSKMMHFITQMMLFSQYDVLVYKNDVVVMINSFSSTFSIMMLLLTSFMLLTLDLVLSFKSMMFFI